VRLARLCITAALRYANFAALARALSLVVLHAASTCVHSAHAEADCACRQLALVCCLPPECSVHVATLVILVAYEKQARLVESLAYHFWQQRLWQQVLRSASCSALLDAALLRES
jgi:hypothetical protein